MTIEIKQSTAMTFLLGPFVDQADGVTPETGLATAMDNASTGIRLSKNGSNMADRSDSNIPVHDEDGFYTTQLNVTDTDTLGLLQVEFTDPTTNLVMWKDFAVVTANYWDAKYGAGVFDANVLTLATAAINAIARAIGIQKNAAFPDITFLMHEAGDHVTPALGLTVTGEMRIDNAAFVAVNGTITEVSDGIYEFDALAADTNGDKITYRFSSAGADDTFVTIKTVD